ncbi:UNVERIFIED_CONTAM: hypothetical protein PYX00_003995 [Menopon gallinae]|uniref:Protein-lysine N-methyltransferase SMYD4 n=1 Tax=Menopon gallinae TaxID=328185 RepID=A0AAW2I411_9NEOP
MNVVKTDVLKEFQKLKSDEERIRFVDKEVIPQNQLNIEWIENGKDLKEAKELKEKGNKAFAKGNDREALKLYTESLMKMPQDSESDLAIVFANRSACLYRMNKFESAITDIENALALNYPKDLRYKVHERKAKCLLAEQRHDEAITEFRTTLQALDDSKLETQKKMKMQTDIQIMLGVMTKPKTKSGHLNVLKPRKETKGEPEPQLCTPHHKVYRSACEKLDVRKEADVGRYAIAAKDIHPGEVLLIEKPYCSVLLGELSRTHCQHCFNRTLAPFPCRTCSGVAFCSKKCQEEANSSYHKYECPVLSTVYSSGASVTVLMALRIITQSPLNFFLNLRSALSNDTKEFEVYNSSDYEALYHLVRHEQLRQNRDFFERTIMAWFLLQCLKKAKYFPTDADEHFIGGLILRHLQFLQFNAHEIFEMELKKGQKLDKSRTVFIGGGIYPTLSLFNHSCDPGVVRYFRGSTVVVRAIKTIGKGEIVAENYGPIFTITKREERRSKLKLQYWFDCQCIACKEDWPSFDGMDNNVFRFRCNAKSDDGRKVNDCRNVIAVPDNTNQVMVRCLSCGQHTNLLMGFKTLKVRIFSLNLSV